jgi:hypothetical protein
MSRHHLREDKTCLNCGATVTERFCSRCGQENTQPKESLGHLVGHFFEDITHFDAKIFVTLKDLVLRPGFLTREYIAGKRVRYLNPIRMYVFISAVFFIAVFAGGEEHTSVPDNGQHATNLFRQGLADSLRGADGASGRGGEVGSGGATGGSVAAVGIADSVRRVVNGEIAARLDTAEKIAGDPEQITVNWNNHAQVVIDIVETKYHNLREYDSVQQKLPDSAKDQGFMHWLLRNNVRLKEEHGYRSHNRFEVDFQHTIPKVMFVLLPLFALVVGWFYSRKKYFYVQHAIFSIHFHSFVFLLFLVALLLAKIIPEGLSVTLSLMGAVLLSVFVYLVAALHGMYRQGFWLSLVKGIAISLIYWIVMLIASVSLMVLAFFRA